MEDGGSWSGFSSKSCDRFVNGVHFLKVVIDESDNINHVIELTEGRVFSSGSESLSISLSALTFLGCNQCNLLLPEQTG